MAKPLNLKVDHSGKTTLAEQIRSECENASRVSARDVAQTSNLQAEHNARGSAEFDLPATRPRAEPPTRTRSEVEPALSIYQKPRRFFIKARTGSKMGQCRSHGLRLGQALGRASTAVKYDQHATLDFSTFRNPRRISVDPLLSAPT